MLFFLCFPIMFFHQLITLEEWDSLVKRPRPRESISCGRSLLTRKQRKITNLEVGYVVPGGLMLSSPKCVFFANAPNPSKENIENFGETTYETSRNNLRKRRVGCPFVCNPRLAFTRDLFLRIVVFLVSYRRSKDFGILKHSVPEYIKNNRDLMRMINDIKEASIEDGGSGAFYIYLKKKL